MTWTPTWWEWALLYGLGIPLLLFVAPFAAMACETVMRRVTEPRALRREAKRSAATFARYESGECYCPVHGWMLKADADEHTRLLHA